MPRTEWECSKENRNYKETVSSNQKEATEILMADNEETRLREFNTHQTHQRQEK